MKTEQKYLNELVAERSKAHSRLSGAVPPERPGRWSSLFCRTDPLSKDIEHQKSSSDSSACFSTSITPFHSKEAGTNLVQCNSTNTYLTENNKSFHEMDLELNFQGLRIRDRQEQTVGIESSDSNGRDGGDICISTPGSPWVTGTSRKNKCLVTRLYLC